MRQVERFILLQAIDSLWVRHLTDLDMLREGINLVSIGQRDPLVEYKREAFAMWEELQDQIQRQVVQSIYRIEPAAPQNQLQQAHSTTEAKLIASANSGNNRLQGPPQRNGASSGSAAPSAAPQTNTIRARDIRATLGGSAASVAVPPSGQPRPKPVAETAPEPIRADVWDKVGRNDPCPCGSGKKFKNCHYPEIQRQRQTVAQTDVKRAVGKRKH